MVFIAPLLTAATICAAFVSAAPQRSNFIRHADSPDPTDMFSIAMSSMDPMVTPLEKGGPHHGSSGQEKNKDNTVTSSGMDSYSSMGKYGSMGDTATAVQTTWTPSASMGDTTAAVQTTSTPPASMGDTTTAVQTTWTPSASMGNTTTTTQTTCTSSTTWSAMNTYSTPSYGSGSYGGSGYQSCMQMCAMSYGAPTMASSTTMWSAPPATSTVASGSGGMTHTVIVAPTQGVLRYVPFAINASIGDTVAFVWNANNHTVTKSSELAICNKTADMPFASGEHNKSFVFTQVVNDTNTTFFYCGTPGHCQKGMFGIINPPNAAAGGNSTVSSMMSAMASNSSNLTSMIQYTEMVTASDPMAAKWGGNIDMSGMPASSYQFVFENVMYTRTFLAANPEALSVNGNVNISTAGATPLVVPKDITAAATNSSGYSTSTLSSVGATSTSSPSPSLTGGARRLGSSSILSFAIIPLAFVLL